MSDPELEPLFLRFSKIFKNNNLYKLNYEITVFSSSTKRRSDFKRQNKSVNRQFLSL